MIIGTGDLASALVDRPGFCFFASGVSNSQETRESEYQREKEMLMLQNRDWRMVYFSSLSVFHDDISRYIDHKRYLETEVERYFPKHTIIRLGNILWGNNPYTLINSLKRKVANQEPIVIKDEYRYLIDKKEFLHWMRLIPPFNCEMNCPGRMMKVKDIVKEYIL